VESEDKICANCKWKIRTIKKGLEKNLQLLPGHLSAKELQMFTLMSTEQSMDQVLG
jgi:hypothetical protein